MRGCINHVGSPKRRSQVVAEVLPKPRPKLFSHSSMITSGRAELHHSAQDEQEVTAMYVFSKNTLATPVRMRASLQIITLPDSPFPPAKAGKYHLTSQKRKRKPGTGESSLPKVRGRLSRSKISLTTGFISSAPHSLTPPAVFSSFLRVLQSHHNFFHFEPFLNLSCSEQLYFKTCHFKRSEWSSEEVLITQRPARGALHTQAQKSPPAQEQKASFCENERYKKQQVCGLPPLAKEVFPFSLLAQTQRRNESKT